MKRLIFQRCQSRGGSLYEPRDYASYAALRAEVKRREINDKFWIGLRWRNGQDGVGRYALIQNVPL